MDNNWHIFLLPVIASFIGWLTNYLAIKMLFHPRNEFSILGIKVQGLFPKRQPEIAKKLGEVISTELLSIKDLQNKLTDNNGKDSLANHLGEKVKEFLSQELPKYLPMLQLVVTPDVAKTIEGALTSSISPLSNKIVKVMASSVESSIDIEGIVEEKVASFSSEKLEEILMNLVRKEFKFIEIVGAVLGFLIGCIQIMLV